MHKSRKFRGGWALAGCAAIAMIAAPPSQAETGAPRDRAALEKQLAEAQSRLDAAARDVANLSMELYGDEELEIAGFVQGGPSGAMLGVNIGGERDRSEGVDVVGVSPGGPAERAGLRAGDVIVSVNGQALKKSGERPPAAQLVAYMRTVQPGQTVKVDYLRDGNRRSANVQAAPAEPAIARVMRDRMMGMPMHEDMGFPRFHELMAPGRGFGPLELVPMTPKLGQYFGSDKGLLVVRVPDQSGLPLDEGDVLLTIGGRTPESPGQAFRILRSYEPSEKVKLGILRNRKRVEVEAAVPSHGDMVGPMHPRRPPMPSQTPAPPRSVPQAPQSGKSASS